MAKRGRKKYANLMAAVIAEKTGDGAEIVETAFQIMRSPEAENRDRLAAAVFLKETLAGKAPLVVEVEETDSLSSLDVDELSDAQLEELSSTLRRVLERTEPDAPAVLCADAPAQLEPAHATEEEVDALREAFNRHTNATSGPAPTLVAHLITDTDVVPAPDTASE